ncbi:MAG: protein kinase [Candidatus Hydrogenedentes bacterium]|nr:protein kinase [Candidatus Hydrogenedentota bacterium]
MSAHEVHRDPVETQSFDVQDAAATPLLGAVVGNYHILSQAGSGGHGAVYKARDIKLGRTVALKMLRFPEDRTGRDTLLSEAQILARLGEHPNIVQIHGWGELGDDCYFVLEYFPTSAAGLLEKSPTGLATRRALEILERCVDAVAFAHRHGILHRDIKPANILVDESSGRIKLCDFGLAQFWGRRERGAAIRAGSPAYMSPEQIRGETLDKSSDIFSLGAAFYQLLSGKLPFEGATATEMMENILAGAFAPLHVHQPDIDPEIDAVVCKCLAGAPAERFASAGELKEAIAAIRHRLYGIGKPRTARHSTWAIYAAAALAVFLGAAVFPAFLQGSGPGANAVSAEARSFLERGEYERACEAYRTVLDEDPDNTAARYGLGYALLLSGETAEASETFKQLSEAALASEGLAAVEQAQAPDAGKARLQALLDSGGSGYAGVLLAATRLAEGDFDAALALLTKVDAASLEFDWQRARYFQELGQAHFREGELALARDAFAQASRLNAPSFTQLAGDYLEMTDRRMEQDQREDLSEQIARLSALREKTPSAAEPDTWISRPLRVWIPPVKAENSPLAVETGLAGVLPWKLGKELLQQKTLPLELVERDFTAGLLAEQQLSAQLSSPDDAVRLGKLLGARVALLCEFNTLFNEESLAAKIVDIETSRITPVQEFTLDKAEALTAWVQAVSAAVVQALDGAYPIRGMLRNTPEGPKLNIGETVGVRPGLRFRVMTGPGKEFLLPDVIAETTVVVGGDSAAVIVQGAAPADIPAAGWFVEAITTAADSGNA